MTRIFTCIFGLLLTTLTSCIPLREFPVEGEFDGVQSALDRNCCVSVLITHGLAGFSEGDPQILINRMAAQLRLCQVGAYTREIIDEYLGCPKSYGYLHRYDFISECDSKLVRVYVLDWRYSTMGEKIPLQCMDAQYSCNRLWLFNKIKKTLVNDAFPDEVLYYSKYRYEIEYPFIQSIRWIEEDSADCMPNENIIVGFSFGGLIAINVLDSMQKDPSHACVANKYIDEIIGVFLLSNSFPLIELSERKANKKHSFKTAQEIGCLENPCSYIFYNECWDWNASPLGRFVYQKRQTLPCFQIVSIHDPNDVISYRATGYLVPSGDSCLDAFLNQNVRNATSAIFGIFINPFTAHQDYGKNKRVANMIIFGKGT